ncbi:MAG: major capsid protein [Azoarcus sp.]|jgi:hypothetical protein|nr:major capsid protein [Azoarcus sp.]
MDIEDLFTVTALTDAVTRLPVAPGQLGATGLFAEKGIRTTSIAIELRNGRLVLIPNVSRNAEAPVVAGGRRGVVTLTACHLPAAGALLPEDIQDVRAFGKESTDSGLEAQASVINDKLAALKADIEATREWHRIGALRGQVLDADASTVLYDLYDTFDVAQQTANVAFSTATTNVRKAVLDAKRGIEKKLGGVVVRGIKAFCGSAFFDALTAHPKVEAAFDNWQAAEDRLAGDQRGGFTYGGVTFIEYAGEVNGVPFIPADKAILYPDAAGVFVTYNAPANYNEAVNTVGQSYYAKSEPRKMGKGWDIEVQANPLTLCLYPEAVVELSAT